MSALQAQRRPHGEVDRGQDQLVETEAGLVLSQSDCVYSRLKSEHLTRTSHYSYYHYTSSYIISYHISYHILVYTTQVNYSAFRAI